MSATTILAHVAAAMAGVATVRTGRAALETTSAALPSITIWSLSDTLAGAQDYDYPTYTRAGVIELKIAASDAYDTALDTALAGIRAALTPAVSADALMFRLGDASFTPPADHGAAALMQVRFEFDYQ